MGITKIDTSMINLGLVEGFINAQNYASGDGLTDDTEALNEALEFAFQQRKALYVPKGVYRLSEVGSTKRCLFNKGVAIFGDGALLSVFAPMADVGTDVDMMLFYPLGTAEFTGIERTGWWPGYPNFDTNLRCKRPIHFVWDGSPEASSKKLYVRENYFLPSNDLSIEMECNPALIAQGSPSNGHICDNDFWGGIKLSNCGDSNVIARNVIRAPVSGRPGIQIFTVDAGDGSAGHNAIRDNNIDSCPGGAIHILNGREYIIDGNNIEHRTGGGSPSAAVVDIDGTSGAVLGCKVTNNRVAVFGHSTAQTGIRLNAVANGYVSENTLDAGGSRQQAILTTANALHTRFGRNVYNGSWVQQINNNGADSLKINYVALTS